MTSKRWLSVLMLLLCSTGVFAQKEDEAAKEKQRRQMLLIESIQADSRELRLGENRAVVFAKLGAKLWEFDQKRAQDFFEDSVTELIRAQTAIELERKSGNQSELLTGQSTRPQILQAIAARNAEFALQSLYRTRPAAIERAIFSIRVKDSKIRGNSGTDQHYAQNELQLEQILTKMAADQNPERAIALLKAALKGGVSGETLNLLRKLFDKDPAAANELASEIVAQISRKSFLIANQPDYQTIQVANSFLSEFIRSRPSTEKALRFDISQMRSLAEKMINFYIERGSQYGYGLGPSIIQIAEKLVPASVEKLKQVEKNMPQRGFRGFEPNEDVARLTNAETPVEQVLAEVSKLPLESRRQVYQSAATRLTAAGDFARARSILTENFSDDALENAVSSLNWYYAHQLMNQGRFTEAESVIDEFPDSNRHSALVSLAQTAYSRDMEKNKSYAAALLEKARSQIPSKPETSSEMSQTMQIIAAYSRIEPAEGFRMFDGLVQQINELTEAAIVFNGFQGSSNIRQGEMIIVNGGSLGIYIDFSIIRGLAQTDFDRAMSLIGAFSRREMRVSLKQQLLEGL